MSGGGEWVWIYLRVDAVIWAAACVVLAVLALVGTIRTVEAVMAAAFLALTVGAIWFFVDTIMPVLRDQSDPEDLLRRRLATGEIDEDEYRRLRSLLRERDG
jgi:uncharacterized membrane protein